MKYPVQYQERSISFSRGKGKLNHTDRTIIAPNVDASRTRNNVVLINESLSDAYEKIFGEVLAEYNAKQKRKDRKIDDYFHKLFSVSATEKSATEVITNRNKQQSFYEWVVGVGGAYDTAIIDWKNDNGEVIKANPKAVQLAVECLTEYITGNPDFGVQSYQERNPNFHVVKAIIHMDEKTPHLHLDAVPFADGYKKGMTRQQGIAKALEVMGYGIGEQAIAKWQQSERDVFRGICERHGFTIRAEEKSRGYTVLTRQYGEFAENEKKLKQQQAMITKMQSELAETRTELSDEQQRLEIAKSKNEISRKNLLNGIPSLALEPYPEEPKEPKPPKQIFYFDDKTEKKEYEKAWKEYQKAHKQYLKALKGWKKECEEIDSRNAVKQDEWNAKYLTVDNVRKTQMHSDNLKAREKLLKEQEQRIEYRDKRISDDVRRRAEAMSKQQIQQVELEKQKAVENLQLLLQQERLRTEKALQLADDYDNFLYYLDVPDEYQTYLLDFRETLQELQQQPDSEREEHHRDY